MVGVGLILAGEWSRPEQFESQEYPREMGHASHELDWQAEAKNLLAPNPQRSEGGSQIMVEVG